MSIWIRRIVLIVIAAALVGAVVFAFMPEAVPVEALEVTRGPLQVTVDEDGKTRITERYVVSAPLTGRLRRVVLDPGDDVAAGDTVVATIDPTDPALLDTRAVAEAEARVRAATAAVRRAGANLEAGRSTFDFAESEMARLQRAYDSGGATELEHEAKTMLYRRAAEELRGLEFAEEIAKFELEQAESAVLRTRPHGDSADDGFEIRAPIDGCVLRVFQESMSVITPGTAILEVGDPVDLELEIDVLSTDAVRIEPGAEVIIEHWGGDEPLLAAVRLVEPSAFTKVSALGVEEQRVNVIADFVSPFEERETLGDGFRVEARIVVWSGDDVVRVPVTALFRSEGAWAVFVVENDRAVRRVVEVGRQTPSLAEVVSGLEPGEDVIAHPSDRVRDGAKVSVRD